MDRSHRHCATFTKPVDIDRESGMGIVRCIRIFLRSKLEMGYILYRTNVPESIFTKCKLKAVGQRHRENPKIDACGVSRHQSQLEAEATPLLPAYVEPTERL